MYKPQISKYYFIYYHRRKYAFAEGNIKSGLNGFACNIKKVIVCVINEKLSNAEKQKVRHEFLKNSELRFNTKIKVVIIWKE